MGQCTPSFESLTELSFLGEDISQVRQVLHEGDLRWLHTFLQAAASSFHAEGLHRQ